MVKPEWLNLATCSIETSSDGWILIAVLSLMTAIQLTAMGSFTIIRYQLATSGSFNQILQARQPAPLGVEPDWSQQLYGPPDGWDHQLFATEVIVRDSDLYRDIWWQIKLKQQPHRSIIDPILAATRTRVVFLIDDSLSMNWSTGEDYSDDALYLQHNSGQINMVPDNSDITDSYQAAEGLYFRGYYGNQYLRAEHADSLGGAISTWSKYYTQLESLAAKLELCEVAILTTSGCFFDFTTDLTVIKDRLQQIKPVADDAIFVSSFIEAAKLVKDRCLQSGHIIIFSDGESQHAPKWPAALWAEDGDQLVLPGLSSLIELALKRKIKVSMVGINSDDVFPLAAEIVPQAYQVNQMPLLPGAKLLSASGANFNLASYDLSSAAFYRLNPTLAAVAPFSVQGVVVASFQDEEQLYCATRSDQLLKIKSQNVAWMIDGCGGELLVRGNQIIAGPDSQGLITVINDRPELLWRVSGRQAAASNSTVYIASGSQLLGYQLQDGVLVMLHDLNEEISAIRYDPVRGLLYVGSVEGNLYVFDQDLSLHDTHLGTDLGSIEDIRAFSWRRQNYLIGISAKHLTAFGSSGVIWDIAAGLYERAIVMDGKLYLNTWQLGSDCIGIDSGSSQLGVWDLLSGESVASRSLGKGRAFGPAVDLIAAELLFVNANGSLIREDISDLPGVKRESLGSYLKSE